jgi:hypothetical protein
VEANEDFAEKGFKKKSTVIKISEILEKLENIFSEIPYSPSGLSLNTAQNELIAKLSPLLNNPAIRLDEDKYLINDRRKENSFFHKEIYKEALLSRARSYFNACLILIAYIHFQNPNKVYVELKDSFEKFDSQIENENEIEFNSLFRKLVNILNSNLSNIKNSEEIWSSELNNAEVLYNWTRRVKTVITLSCIEGGYTLVQYDIPILSQTVEQNDEFSLRRYSPYSESSWLNALSVWQRDFFTEISKNPSDLLFTQPSTFRRYPGLPFYMQHGVLIFNRTNQLVGKSMRVRSSLAVPFQISDQDEKDTLTRQNIYQFISNELPLAFTEMWGGIQWSKAIKPEKIKVPILYQTLLSPLGPLGIGKGETSMFKIKYEQFALIEMIIADTYGSNSLIELIPINTNYGVNSLAQGLLGVFLGKPVNNVSAIKDIIGCAIAYFEVIILLSQNPQTKEKIENFIWHLRELKINFFQNSLNSSLFKGVNNINLGDWKLQERVIYIVHGFLAYLKMQRNKRNTINLFLAALENSLISKMGGLSLSSCKSGKDRNGLLQLIADALEIYFVRYGTMPPLMENKCNSPGRKKFDEIVSVLFKSGHQAIMASTNAQGCVGLKSVQDVLPKQNLVLLGDILLEASDNCASLNRPSIKASIKPGKKITIIKEKLTPKDSHTHISSLDTVRNDFNKLITINSSQQNIFSRNILQGIVSQSPTKIIEDLSRDIPISPKIPPKKIIPEINLSQFWMSPSSSSPNRKESNSSSVRLSAHKEIQFEHFLEMVKSKDYKKLSKILELDLNKIINKTDKEGKNALHYAIIEKNIQIIELLIKHGIDVNCQDQGGFAPIHLAIYSKDSKILKILLEIPSLKINILDEEEKNALHHAISLKNVEMVKMLLEKGIDIEKEDTDYQTPMGITIELKASASEEELSSINEIIVLLGTSNQFRLIEKKSVSADFEDFIVYIREHDFDNVKRILDQNQVNRDQTDHKGNNGLYHAFEMYNSNNSNCIRIIETLINFGVSLDQGNNDGYTPRELAQDKRIDLDSLLKINNSNYRTSRK